MEVHEIKKVIQCSKCKVCFEGEVIGGDGSECPFYVTMEQKLMCKDCYEDYCEDHKGIKCKNCMSKKVLRNAGIPRIFT